MSDRSAAEALSAECQHWNLVVYGAADGSWPLWACSDCKLRFYPACRECVDVGHRNVVHPALDRERAAAPTLGIEEAIARGQAMLAASEAAADREITRLNDRIVALNAEVLDRMDQWHRDSLARDELARQQAAEIARLREADRERSEAVTLALTELRREVEEALMSEDEIAHGEAWLYDGDNAGHGVGVCAYCDDKWPCRTQRGIDRLRAALIDKAVPRG